MSRRVSGMCCVRAGTLEGAGLRRVAFQAREQSRKKVASLAVPARAVSCRGSGSQQNHLWIAEVPDPLHLPASAVYYSLRK
jgi:hypothetical protein